MPAILAEILSLIQYKSEVGNNPNVERPAFCIRCGVADPWKHATYPRQSDRINTSSLSLNPVLIQRYYCSDCHRTFSVLPECIPPRRWYLWDMQAMVLLLCLAGTSASAVAKEVLPSRQTVRRWFKHFQAQYRLHRDVLCGHFVELGRFSGLSGFWQAALKTVPLSTAMRLCHVAGVAIP